MEKTLLNENIYIPAKVTWAILGVFITAIILIGPWFANIYNKTQKVDMLESKMTNFEVRQSLSEQFQTKTDERLSNIEVLMKETRDDVKKILTAPQYNQIR